MKGIITTLLAVSLVGLNAWAETEVTTHGKNGLYTFAKLAETDTTGVTRDGDAYVVSKSITISATDTLRIENNSTIKLGDKVKLTIMGVGDFAPADTATITRDAEAASPVGVYVSGNDGHVLARNMRFEYGSLCSGSVNPLIVDNCTFVNTTNEQTTSGVISFRTSSDGNVISRCNFIDCDICAIGGAANFVNGVKLVDCYMSDCNRNNVNKPFINLTVGGDYEVEVTGNTIVGAQRDKVGGIGVSNMINLAGTNNVVIKNNTVSDCRYGITTIGAMTALIDGNTLTDNRYESNPNNGGSGVSLYDPYYKQKVVMCNNKIEGSLWGVTVIGCNDVNLGKIDDKTAADYNAGNNVFKDNGNNGSVFDVDTPYDLYNNSANTVYAQGNTWSVAEQDSVSIERVIFHKNDNASLGEVIFMPRSSASVTATGANIVKIGYDKARALVTVPESSTVEVYTTAGSKVLEKTSATEVSIADLPSGIYIVKVKNAAGGVLKIMK